MVLAGLVTAIPCAAQQKAQKENQEPGMAEAIRFEKAKAAADARQAKLEAEHPCGCASPADVLAAKSGTKPVTQRASAGRPKK
jgi:hypothetical protein